MYGSTTTMWNNSYFLCFFRALQKSTSIPVHLSVSRTNEVGLPPGLRPKHNLTSTASNGGHQTGLRNNFYTYTIQFFSFWLCQILIWNLKKPKEIQNILFHGNIKKGTPIQKLQLTKCWIFGWHIFWHFCLLCFVFLWIGKNMLCLEKQIPKFYLKNWKMPPFLV